MVVEKAECNFCMFYLIFENKIFDKDIPPNVNKRNKILPSMHCTRAFDDNIITFSNAKQMPRVAVY